MDEQEKKAKQDVVDRIVADIVPAEYQPSKFEVGKEPPLLTNVSIMDASKFDELLGHFAAELGDIRGVEAFNINWGVLRRRAQLPDFSQWMNSHAIFLRGGVTDGGALKTSFVVMHEIGHIDWAQHRKGKLALWEDKNEEIYCDIYAYSRLQDLWGEDVAYLVLELYGSDDGWNRYKGDPE